METRWRSLSGAAFFVTSSRLVNASRERYSRVGTRIHGIYDHTRTHHFTAAPLVDWRNENGGQYAQAITVGIIRFVTSLFYFYSDYKWVPASNYRSCINEIWFSDGCRPSRSTLPVVKLRKFDWERRLRTKSGNLEYGCTDIGPPEGDVYWTGGSIFITGGPI